MQRGHYFAIVDEVDSILIDEARTPLIISGPTQDEVKWYGEFAKIAARLVKDVDYEVDEKKRTISILEPGITKVEDHLGIDNLYDSVNTPLISFLNNSIKAKELFRNDKEYVVMDDEVLIVDEHTGRMLSGRRYNDGLHQAIEAKEGVTVREEYQTLATITLQNYFRLYDKLSGMTGTAMTEASEFDKIYSSAWCPIRTNKPMARIDQPPTSSTAPRTPSTTPSSTTSPSAHAKGQPVLVGTISVEKSEHLSQLLKKRGVAHTVLNAKQHADEAKIVAMAGHKGAVTVATNMAGRGTDIMLGGSVEFLADQQLRAQGPRPARGRRGVRGRLARDRRADRGPGRGRARRGQGGRRPLRRRHRAPRVAPDRQPAARSFRPSGRPGRVPVLPVPRGRADAAVQVRLGRPGAARAEGARRRTDREQVGHQVDRVRAGARSSRRTSRRRKNVLKYDDVMSRQREVIYAERREVLEGADLKDQIRLMIDDAVASYVGAATEGFPEEWDLEALWTALRTMYPITLRYQTLEDEAGGRDGLDRDELLETLQADAQAQYDAREAELGEEVTRELERRVLLSVLDRKWREHLYEMDYLREGIGLRAYSQRDPLVEYQREGFDMFHAMKEGIREETVGFLFHIEVRGRGGARGVRADAGRCRGDRGRQPAGRARRRRRTPRTRRTSPPRGSRRPKQPTNLTYSAPSEDGDAEVHGETVSNADDAYSGISRNAMCPCGSGKKYKRCHGAPGGPTGLTTRAGG